MRSLHKEFRLGIGAFVLSEYLRSVEDSIGFCLLRLLAGCVVSQAENDIRQRHLQSEKFSFASTLTLLVGRECRIQNFSLEMWIKCWVRRVRQICF